MSDPSEPGYTILVWFDDHNIDGSPDPVIKLCIEFADTREVTVAMDGEDALWMASTLRKVAIEYQHAMKNGGLSK